MHSVTFHSSIEKESPQVAGMAFFVLTKQHSENNSWSGKFDCDVLNGVIDKEESERNQKDHTCLGRFTAVTQPARLGVTWKIYLDTTTRCMYKLL